MLDASLRSAAKLVDNGELEAVRALLREPLFTTYIGYSPGLRGNAANLKPPQALVAAGVESAALSELLLSLKRLDDFCLTNRVIVFNAEDLEQVKGLMASSGRDGGENGRIDLDEARAFLADAREALQQALKSVER